MSRPKIRRVGRRSLSQRAKRITRRGFLEKLESRELLAGDVSVLPGDLLLIELTRPNGASGEFRFDQATIDFQPSDQSLVKLVQRGAAGSWQIDLEQRLPLRDTLGNVIEIDQKIVYQDPVFQDFGRLFFVENVSAEQVEPFATSGKWVFAPPTKSDLPGDANVAASAPGFQGDVHFQFSIGDSVQPPVTVTVGNGFSSGGEAAVTGIGSKTEILRLQQRLKFLGYLGADGQPLALTSVLDPNTNAALQTFKAAVDLSGEHTPTDESPQANNPLDDSRTLRWLNAANAPRWEKLSNVGLLRPFATSWLANALDHAGTWRDAVLAASATAPESRPLHPNTSWGKHLGGMDLDLRLGTVDAAHPENNRWVAFVTALANANDDPQRAVLTRVRVNNAPLANHLRSVLQRGDDFVVLEPSLDGSAGSGVLHLDFAPPALDALVTDEVAALKTGVESLANHFTPGANIAELRQPLPLVGTTAPLAANAAQQLLDQQITLAKTLNIDSQTKALFASITTYLAGDATPTISELRTAMLNHPGVTGVTLHETEERLEFEVEFHAAATQRNLTLDPGSLAHEGGLRLTEGANSKLDFSSTLDFQFTLGLDRSQLDRPNEAVQIKVAELKIDGKVDEAGLNFVYTNGLLGGSTSTATTTLDATVIATSDIFLTAADIAAPNASLATLLDVTPSGSAVATFPASQELFGQEAGTIVLRQPSVFAGAPLLNFEGDDPCLSTWSNYGTDALRGLLAFVEDSLVAWQDDASSVFTYEVPLTSIKDEKTGQDRKQRIDDFINLVDIWRGATASLYSIGNQLAVSTVQGFLEKLNGVAPNPLDPSQQLVKYDPTSCSILFGFNIQHEIDPIKVPLAIDIPIGPLSNAKPTSQDPDAGQVVVTAGAGLQFHVGLDLRPLGEGFGLGPTKKLKDLHGGGKNPLDQNVDGQDDLRITLSDGRSFSINFDGLALDTATVGDAIEKITSVVPADSLEVRIDTRFGRLELIDKTGSLPTGNAVPFQVEPLNGSQIGMSSIGLGIIGAVEKANADGLRRLYGTALHGDSLQNHLYISTDDALPSQITAHASVDGRALQASANFGFVEVGIINATVNASLEVNATLQDPGTGPHNDQRITVNEFREGLSKGIGNDGSLIKELERPCSASLRLPIDARMDGESLFVNGGGAAPAIVASITYCTQPSELKVDYGLEGDFSGLINYGQLAAQKSAMSSSMRSKESCAKKKLCCKKCSTKRMARWTSATFC